MAALICSRPAPRFGGTQQLDRYYITLSADCKPTAGVRGGTSQDFNDSSHSSRVSALTRDSRVRAKMCDWKLILLFSVTI